MPKQVQGYLTSSGEFFESAEKAEYVEAGDVLHEAGHRSIEVGVEQVKPFMMFVEKNIDIVMRFCMAAANYNASLNAAAPAQEEVIIEGDDNGTSAEPATTEEQNEEPANRRRTRRSKPKDDRAKV